jgi:hypothetical protein
LAVAGEAELALAPAAERALPVRVRLPAQAVPGLSERALPIRFEVTQLASSGRDERVQEPSTFLLPR